MENAFQMLTWEYWAMAIAFAFAVIALKWSLSEGRETIILPPEGKGYWAFDRINRRSINIFRFAAAISIFANTMLFGLNFWLGAVLLLVTVPVNLIHTYTMVRHTMIVLQIIEERWGP